MMSFPDLYQQYRQMTDHRILMSFKGVFAQPAIVEMASALRGKVASRTNQTMVMKRVFAIFVELSQNILFYSAEKEKDEEGKENGVGILIVNEMDDRYCVSSGNLMHTTNVERMRTKCDTVSSMTKEELKVYYNEQRKLPRSSESKGAGLGLIDIARKSEYAIEYGFTPFNDEYSFYMLSVYISKGQEK
jgi:Family of unknown function (DUF6272)